MVCQDPLPKNYTQVLILNTKFSNNAFYKQKVCFKFSEVSNLFKSLDLWLKTEFLHIVYTLLDQDSTRTVLKVPFSVIVESIVEVQFIVCDLCS